MRHALILLAVLLAAGSASAWESSLAKSEDGTWVQLESDGCNSCTVACEVVGDRVMCPPCSAWTLKMCGDDWQPSVAGTFDENGELIGYGSGTFTLVDWSEVDPESDDEYMVLCPGEECDEAMQRAREAQARLDDPGIGPNRNVGNLQWGDRDIDLDALLDRVAQLEARVRELEAKLEEPKSIAMPMNDNVYRGPFPTFHYDPCPPGTWYRCTPGVYTGQGADPPCSCVPAESEYDIVTTPYILNAGCYDSSGNYNCGSPVPLWR